MDAPLSLRSLSAGHKTFLPIAGRSWWIMPVTRLAHHICSLIKSPLECLKDSPSGRTSVVVLDSFPEGTRNAVDEDLWSRLLIRVWDSLGDDRISFGLSSTRPTVEEIHQRLQFYFPKVSVDFQETSILTLLKAFTR